MAKEPRVTPETPKDRKGTLLRLWKYLCRHKWMVALALFLTVLKMCIRDRSYGFPRLDIEGVMPYCLVSWKYAWDVY